MSNVIPLFGKQITRNDARTHFIDPVVEAAVAGTEYEWDPDALSTMCGRIAERYLDGILDPIYPECEACRDEWRERTGWALPLPAVVSTG